MTDHQERPPTALPTLGEILARVLEGSIFLNSFYTSLDCDAALDDRETDIGFDEEWVYLFNQVDAAWKPAGVADAVSDQVATIRRESYDLVYRATGHHEMAAQVADDLELLARGVALNRDDHLLVWLWTAYHHGQLPMPWSPRISHVPRGR